MRDIRVPSGWLLDLCAAHRFTINRGFGLPPRNQLMQVKRSVAV